VKEADPMADAAAYRAYLAGARSRHLEELSDWLRIQSISTLPDHAADMKRAADWTADQMRAVGLEHVAVMPTGGHPVVYGDWLHAPGRPTLLVYGHYDVQPADPLDLWQTPPFLPTIRDGKLFARGAADDKGQIFLHLKAVEALRAVDGSLPLNLKFIVEGEEECASENLQRYIRAEAERLRCEVAAVSDSPMLGPDTPSLSETLRGIATLEITLRTGRGDLHSGLYGGAAPNALHELCALVAKLHDEQGRVAVPGFYDAVKPLTPAERAGYEALPFDEADFRAEVGAPDLTGEAGYTVLERIWRRPTLECNGVFGGFEGAGTKTVIPCVAHAKISCRLVADQDPGQIADLVAAHVRRLCPPTATVEVEMQGGGHPAFTSRDHPAMQAAARAMAQAFGKAPVFAGMGGSIPVVPMLQRDLRAAVVLLGFGLPSEPLHAPNEYFTLSSFDRGLLTCCLFYAGLDATSPSVR
jgi:acetylornithine deacetylase/succinyl-diaminopimelate desuccinylase-like protein